MLEPNLVTNPTSSSPFRIASIIPQSGPAGLFGPSCSHCLTLAVEEVNSKGGIIGRPVQLLTIDGGQRPHLVADELSALLSENLVDCIVGMHDSDVRTSVLRVAAGRLPYVYTPTYEGGEFIDGLFCLGETPEQIVCHPLRWLIEQRAIGRWHFVGNDYIWPRRLVEVVADVTRLAGGELIDRDLVPIEYAEFDAILDAIEREAVEGVFVSLVGSSSVAFNRQFLARKFDRVLVRFDPLTDANIQMAIGHEAENRLFTASAYLSNSPAPRNQQFRSAYDRRFGANAPEITSLSAGCYDGVHFIASLAAKAGSAEIAALNQASVDFAFEGVRGSVTVQQMHLRQSIHLIEFRDGLEVEIAVFSDVPPGR